jgi:hypothetical protein
LPPLPSLERHIGVIDQTKVWIDKDADTTNVSDPKHEKSEIHVIKGTNYIHFFFFWFFLPPEPV